MGQQEIPTTTLQSYHAERKEKHRPCSVLIWSQPLNICHSSEMVYFWGWSIGVLHWVGPLG